MTTGDGTENGRQRQSFLQGEGNRWFARNDGQDIAPHTRLGLDILSKYIRPGGRILEIGCGGGASLACLRRTHSELTCHGIEPSADAVAAAHIRYPSLDVRVGAADTLPYEDGDFDLVYFGFCLYLVDRELLFRAIAEADRVLRNPGYLGIIDFDPAGPRKRRYRHLDGVYSYKMDYSALFLASPHYRLADKTSYSHAGADFHPDPAERVSTCVLYKNVESGYSSEDD